MTNFIETQKELAREEMRGMYYDDSDEFPHLLDTLITQVIQNTLEEVGRRTEPDNTVSLIAQAIRERDTYWKERVRKEVEGISEFNAKLAISPSPDFLEGAVAIKKMILDNLK